MVDDGLFEVRVRGVPCRLGNTIPLRLVCRLNRERGRFVRFRSLLADVWQGRRVGRNTVHKTVGNVRRLFRDRGLVGVEIEAEPDAYRLVVSGG